MAWWYDVTLDGEANPDPWRVQRRWRRDPVRFKVVSEEWCAVVDVARPLRVELRFGSMSQSNLGEELSRSSRIRAWCFGCLMCMVRQQYFGKGSYIAVTLSVWCSPLTSTNVSPELGDRQSCV